MALQPFDSRLLEMLYIMANSKRPLFLSDLAKIPIAGELRSKRTISRWLKYMQSQQYFTYYPRVRFSKLGLKIATVMLSDLTTYDLLNIIPYKVYLMAGTELSSAERRVYVQYLVPPDQAGAFRDFWLTAKKLNLISRFDLFFGQEAQAYYPAIHKITDRNGALNFKNEVSAGESHFNSLLKKAEPVMHPKIKQNPIIVPLLLERFKDFKTSWKIWQAMKAKMGDNAWAYIQDRKIRFEKRDGLAIAYVQKALRELYSNFETFFTGCAAEYLPLYIAKDRLNILTILESNEFQRCPEVLCELSKKTAYIVANRLDLPNYALVDFVTSPEGLIPALDILSRNCRMKHIFLVNNKDILRFRMEHRSSWFKSSYADLFDPENCTWCFEKNKYLEALRELSLSGR